MQKVDLNTVDQIIREVGAEIIMPRFQKLTTSDVKMKGVDDPVTVADKESEWSLSEKLTKYLPHSTTIGEEAYAEDKTVLRRLQSDQPIWIIDPIDGTRNFVAGKPEFATMVALVIKGKPVASWIHDPNSLDTIMAETGSGVWLRGQRLKLATLDDNVPTVGLMGSRVRKLINDPAIIPTTIDLPLIEIGSCASFDYPRLFTGSINFANSKATRAGFLLYRHTNLWDHVPGMFMHQEGGGYSADWAGNPYDFSNPLSGLLYASNKDNWIRLYDLFEPLMKHTLERTPWVRSM